MPPSSCGEAFKDMEYSFFQVGGVIFLAAFTQSLSGFGSALVAMAILPALLGLQVATPFVALFALTIDIILLIRFRQSIDIRAIWPVVLAALIGTPMGVNFLSRIDENIALTLLGLVISGYALYALLDFKLPALTHSIWAWLAGFFGGLLGGAYNTSGPPVILYADCRRWPPDVFKGNLQGYFLISSVAVLISHYFSGNLTAEIWLIFLGTLPFVFLGVILGLFLARILNPVLFRKVVLFLLIFMGLRLMLYKA
jgi:uncharacterized membrane protein YfcA